MRELDRNPERNGNCGLPDGVVHMHTERCYKAGAVEALREAADKLLAGCVGSCDHPDLHNAAVLVSNIADRIERTADAPQDGVA